MNKLSQVIFVVLAIVIGSQAAKFGIREYSNYSNEANLKKNLIAVAEKLNNETPIVVDKHTKITEVKVENDLVIYSVILDGFDYENIDVSRMSKMQMITNLFHVCQNDETTYLIKNGLNIEYEYFTPTNSDLFSNRITQKDCQPFYSSNFSAIVERFVELNREVLPMKLDAETNLINIKGTKSSIELVYELMNYNKNELDVNAVKKFVEENSPTKNCTSPDTKIFLNNGLSVIDTYLDKSGATVFSYETDSTKC